MSQEEVIGEMRMQAFVGRWVVLGLLAAMTVVSGCSSSSAPGEPIGRPQPGSTEAVTGVAEKRQGGLDGQSQGARQPRASETPELLSLQVENDQLRREVADLKSKLEAHHSNPHSDFLHTEKRLKEQGLRNPVFDLVNDLRQRTDLLPVSGTLGGTMAFRKVESWVVTDKWVLAHFDDGHSGGTILLEYTVSDGIIHWSLVDFVLH